MATVSRVTKIQRPTSRKGGEKWGTQRGAASKSKVTPNEPGRFGVYGGRYVPETLMAALDELEREYEKAKKDPRFQARLDELLRTYAGRPTPLFFARRLTEKLGGAKIYLKREDLLHTGAHKINNCLGQGLLVERMGKHRVIAETGAGQHGVATATVCALLGFECVVYMGTEDMRRQELNVFRMRLLGAEVRGVESGSRTLKDAINEAMRDWVTNVRTTHYLLGSVLGAHPYPTMVRDFHQVIGREARGADYESRRQTPAADHRLCGRRFECDRRFYEFIKDKKVQLIGVEAGGRSESLGDHAARFRGGSPGVLQGTYSYVLQDRSRADCADAFGFGGAGLSFDRPGARWLARCRAGGICPGIRRRGTRSRELAGSNRRHHSGAGIGARGGRSHQARAEDEKIGSCHRQYLRAR